jgi:hypothetical protein
MSQPTIAIGIHVYANPDRFDRLMQNILWSGVPADIKIRVFEDPKLTDTNQEISKRYQKLCEKYNVSYYRAPSWGCIHGIVQFAVMNSPEDWFIYVPDDVLFTKGHFQGVVDHIYKYNHTCAGMFQTPYWNAHEYKPGWPSSDYKYLWTIPIEKANKFLETVPENPHWSHEDKMPYLYINVNGAGFALRRKVWEEVGGFSPKTWCFDEDIAVRCLMYSRYHIFAIAGKPSIHLFAGSTLDGTQPQHQFSTLESWIKAWGMDKTAICKLSDLAQMPPEGRRPNDINDLPMRKCGLFFDKDKENIVNEALAATGTVRITR